MRNHVRFIRNGRVVELANIRPSLTVLDYLRLVERQTGTKASCGEGYCGACTIVLVHDRDGGLAYEAVNACTLLVAEADGCEILTVEDLAEDDGTLHPIQEALVAHHATHCGFCSPGMAMSLLPLFQERRRNVGEAEIQAALQGNLCRCSGYRAIIKAGVAACASPRQTHLDGRREQTANLLAGLQDGEELRLDDGVRFLAAPASLDRALEICTERPGAAVAAGGASARSRMRAASYGDEIVLLSRVAEMRRYALAETEVVLGAATTLAAATGLLANIDQDIAHLIGRIGGRQYRALATIGGDLMLGGGDSELAAIMLALGAEAVFRIGDEVRRVGLDAVYASDGSVYRELGKLLVEIHIPRPPHNTVIRAYKVAKGDGAPLIVSGGFCFTLDPEGVIDNARIGFGGVGAAPARAHSAEAALIGTRPLDRTAWPVLFSALRSDFTAVTNHRGSARYKADTAQALLGKALIEAGSLSDARTRLRTFRQEGAIEAG